MSGGIGIGLYIMIDKVQIDYSGCGVAGKM